MGAYWGSKYVAYLPEDIFESKVVQVDLKPCGMSMTSDKLYLPLDLTPELKGHDQFDSKDKAKLAVKRHILLKSGDDIQALLWAIEDARQDIELIKMTEEKDDHNTQLIKVKEELILDFTDKTKTLRRLRRAKVTIS